MASIKYDKIVRDNIPEIINKANKECKIKTVVGTEKAEYLLKKAHEEINELTQARNIEEMADVLEVVDAIIDSLSLNRNEIEHVRKVKREKNGAFKNGIVLLEVEDQK